ncbi:MULTISPECIES: MFS transporter [Alphaproteobacteria]|uniref:MFS transporter n=2 Tax=Alphaproteobacteria TaxID=28211 RepID=A0A512HE73_9HYPH|nr:MULTISPECIES: MFS transporter [Alphaproteobacteria]GEO83752.1 MFS transporter [Ciceribacter naphthalenivorans]GLR24096.1 MFS transporter [Ciceribacter naphthalenivorans]GLT06952.1 MFS transporter [Sphingomonas psychrolutea]
MKALPSTLGLGVSMTIGYGTLYYSFSVLAPEIAREFGWSQSFVFAVFSVGLLGGAVSAPIIGRLVDHYGARPVLAFGSIFAAAALALLSKVENGWQFAMVTLMAEFVSIAVQYDAGFAALAQRYGQEARSQITVVTLVAGFASTVFWPLIQWLLTMMTWRDVYLVLAALNLALALPVHALWPSYRREIAGAEQGASDTARAESPSRRTQLVLMAVSLSAGGFVLSAMGASLLVLLGDAGYTPAIATLAGSLIGPSQVGARVMEYVRRGVLSPPVTGLIATGAIFLALSLLFAAALVPAVAVALAFAVFFGIGQGLTSIIRGVLPLHYFGAAGYGRTMGTLSGIRMVLSAAAPVTIIFVNEQLGVAAAIGCLLVMGTVGLVAMIGLSRLPSLPTDAQR